MRALFSCGIRIIEGTKIGDNRTGLHNAIQFSFTFPGFGNCGAIKQGMGNILFTLFATFWSVQPSIVDEWILFVDPKEQFEVSVPDSATLTTTKVNTALGVLDYVVVTSRDETSDLVKLYTVSYCDYPKGVFHKDSTEFIELFFSETVAQAVESMDGDLLYNEDYLGAKYPTRLWKIVSEKLDIHVKSKALIVGDRYYCLQVTTSGSQSVHVSGNKFFDSFKVTHK